MLKNITPINIDLYVDQGDTYYKEFNISDGILPVDLTGYVFELDVKEYIGTAVLPLYFVVTAPIPSAGAITVTATAIETQLMYRPRYIYRLTAKLPNPVQPPIAIPPAIQLPPNPPLESVVLMFGQIQVSNF
jgi:hypothetical protein